MAFRDGAYHGRKNVSNVRVRLCLARHARFWVALGEGLRRQLKDPWGTFSTCQNENGGLGEDGRSSVDRQPSPIEHPPEQAEADTEPCGVASQSNDSGGEVEPSGPREDLDHRSLPVDFEDLAAHGVRVALRGHAPFAVAMKAAHDALKALRAGVAPADLPGQPDPDFLKRLTRQADYDRRLDDYLS